PSPRLALLSFPTRRSSDLVSQEEDFLSRQRLILFSLPVVLQVTDEAFFTLFQQRWVSSEHTAFFEKQRQIDAPVEVEARQAAVLDRKSTRLNSSHVKISYA